MAGKQSHGQLAHFALNVDDMERAAAFYGALFGWVLEPWGPPGFFMVAFKDGQGAAVLGSVQGRRELVKGSRATGPECSFAVDDIDAAVRTITDLGGEIVMAKSTIPTVGQLVFFKDTEGNVMGAMQYE